MLENMNLCDRLIVATSLMVKTKSPLSDGNISVAETIRKKCSLTVHYHGIITITQ